MLRFILEVKMRRVVIFLLVLSALLDAKIIQKESRYDFKTTILKLKEAIKSKGFKIEAVINQGENAKKVKAYSPDATTIFFDKPSQSARIMLHDSSVGYALPQKIYVYDNMDAKSIVVYEPFSELKRSFKVENCMLIDKISKEIDEIVKSITK
jgi:uncharacterized protein (DUF302 family)